MNLSFKNDPTIKESLIQRMDKHIELDELVQKATGQDGKGCTVWCALNNGDLKAGYNHEAFESVLGLPEWLARLHDTIYEGLEVKDSKWFSKEWVRAVPVGVNLDIIKWKFCVFILKENIERVLLLDIDEKLKKQIVDAIKQCLDVQEKAIETGNWDGSAARSAVRSAWSAESAAWSARSAARSAGESARSAARSARSAAWSAARSARSAAWSAGESAWSVARSAAYKRYANELLRLFREQQNTTI